MDTPIYEIHSESEQANIILIKREDLLPFSLGGNKVRIGWEFYRDMCRTEADCMVIYGDRRSNLCRVLGNICGQKQIPCYMICTSVKESPSLSSNSRMMEWMQVEVIPCQKDSVAQCVQDLFERLEGEGRKPYYIYGNQWGEGREGVPVQAYVDAYQEILRQESQLGVSFDYIFTASGTGATQSGLTAGSLLARDTKMIVGISVSREKERGTRIMARALSQYFKTRGILVPERLEDRICLADEYLQGGYGKFDEQIETCIRRQFLENALPLDPTYTGKAFWGMECYLKDHHIENADVLFLHTGGAPLFYDYLIDEEKMTC